MWELTYGLSQLVCEKQFNIAVEYCPQQVINHEVSDYDYADSC